MVNQDSAAPSPPPYPSSGQADPSLRKRLARAAALPLALTTLASAGLAWQFNRTEKAAGQDYRGDPIIELAHRVETRFAELETASREPAPGDRFARARAALEAPLNDLRARIAADGAAVPHGERLAAAVAAWLEATRQAARAQTDALVAERGATQARVAAAAAAAATQARVAAARSRKRGARGVPPARLPGVGATADSAAVAARDAVSSTVAASEAQAEARRRAEPVRDELRGIYAAEDRARLQAAARRSGGQTWMLVLIFLLPALVGVALVLFLRAQLRAVATALNAEILRARASRDGAQATLRDSSRSLEAAVQGEELYRGIVHAARDYALFSVSRTGVIGSWNPGVETLFGQGAGEWTGRNLGQLFHAADAANEVERVLSVAASHGNAVEEGWLVRKDGTKFWAELLVAPIHADAGPVRKLRGFAVLVRDATRKRRTETELSLLFARVEEEANARDRFLAIAAHELRAPAASLNAELAGLARLESGEGRGGIERAAKLAARLARLVDEMAQLSRAHTGRLGYEYREASLSELVATSLRDLSEQLASAGCAIELRADPAIVGSFDSQRVRQALQHLVANAIRRGHGRPITVEVTASGDRARIGVRDAGPEVERERQHEIFERFSGQSSSQAMPPAGAESGGDDPGFGVGLYLARQIAEGHGGRVWLESKPDVGTTFFFELPLHPVAGGAAGLTVAGLASRQSLDAKNDSVPR